MAQALKPCSVIPVLRKPLGPPWLCHLRRALPWESHVTHRGCATSAAAPGTGISQSLVWGTRCADSRLLASQWRSSWRSPGSMGLQAKATSLHTPSAAGSALTLSFHTGDSRPVPRPSRGLMLAPDAFMPLPFPSSGLRRQVSCDLLPCHGHRPALGLRQLYIRAGATGLSQHMGAVDGYGASAGDARGGDTILDSVVKIFTVASSPNYLLPWQNKPQREITGSGFAISERRILTNAHVVADQTYVLVRKHGSPKRYQADVVAVAHDCDLALLRISAMEDEATDPLPALELALGASTEAASGESTGIPGASPAHVEVTSGGAAGAGFVAAASPARSGGVPSVKSMSAEEEFWEGMVPLEFGDVPQLQEQVAVVGYPLGGDNISITTGVVSRVEPTQYAHSAALLLAIQIDAAINPGNSGGPALMGWVREGPAPAAPADVAGPVLDHVGAAEVEAGAHADGSWGLPDGGDPGPPFAVEQRVAGVTFQNLTGAENIGYIIPVPIIRRFLEDAAAGNRRFSGFSSLGVACQALENNQLRGLLGVPLSATGVVVNSVQPLSAMHGLLQKDDIITAIDGISLANDGSVHFRNKERLPFDCLITLKGPDVSTKLTVLRPKRKPGADHPVEGSPDSTSEASPLIGRASICGELEFEVVLKPLPPLVPTQHFDLPPSYFIFAGLVFVPLTQPYLHEYGPDWYNTSPRRLCERALKGIASFPGQEVVVLSRVLTDQVNSGFERLAELEVKKVNGVPVTNLRGLREAVRSCTEDYLRFDLDDDRVVVMEVTTGKRSSPRILRRYRVPRGVSDDLLGGTGSLEGGSDWWEDSDGP